LVAAAIAVVLAACATGSGSAPAPDVAPDSQAADDTDAAGDTVVAENDSPDEQPWPACPSIPAGAPTLRDKAAYLDALVPAKHLDDGLIRTVRLDGDGNVVSRDHLPSTGLWTAIYLASQSFRYAVTRDAEAVANARVVVNGLHDLTAVTGRPGLYGRAYLRPGVAYTWEAAGSPHWVASPAPGYEGWWYNDAVSKDTMDGIVFGYAAALEFLDDPEILATVRQDVTTFARAFVDAGLQIIDHDGEVTEHGRLYYSAIDDFPGFNALLSMSWVRTAAGAGLDPDLARFYDDCLLRLGDATGCPAIDAIDLGSYLDVFEQFLNVYRPGCKTSYDNIDMVFQAIQPLLRREDRPPVRERLLARLRVGIWTPEEPGIEPPLHRSTHSLYTYLYGGLAQPDPDDPVFRQALEDASCTLHRLERDRFDRTTAAGTQEVACVNRLDKPNAADVIPLEQRYYDNYVWRLDPYEIPEAHAGVPGMLHSPEDWLLAYWVGRYFGFLTEEM
jgi:hypothetical protein